MYSPITGAARPRSQLLETGHIEEAAVLRNRLKDYDKYLLNIRK